MNLGLLGLPSMAGSLGGQHLRALLPHRLYRGLLSYSRVFMFGPSPLAGSYYRLAWLLTILPRISRRR